VSPNLARAHGRESVAVLTAAAMGALFALPALSWPMGTLDEAILLVYPQRMAGGDLPYEDFFAAYGPAFWWGLQGWYALTELSVASMRALGVLVHISMVLAVYCFARPDGRGRALLCAGLSALLLFRLGANPYAWLLSTALCVWQVALLALPQAGRRTALGAGALGGLAIAVRPDTALLALLPALPLVWRSDLWRRWSAGVLLGLVPLWIGLVLTPSALLDNILLGRAGRGAGESRLPIPPLGQEDRRLLAVVLAVALLLVMTAVVTRQRRQTALALLALLALPQAFQRADYTHFVYAGLASLPLLPVALGALSSRLPDLVPGRRFTAPLLAPCLFLVAVPEIPRNVADMVLNGNMQSTTVAYEGREVPEAPDREAVLARLLPRVERLAGPGSTLFVFDSNLRRPAVTDLILYYYLPRLRQSAYHMEITPGITSERGSGLREDLLAADVVVLVGTPEADRRVLFPYAHDGSTEAEDALRARFCHRESIDRFELYVRCR